jgi:hypothetical protein
MKDPISITIPFEYHALTRASDFLHGLAQDAKVAGMQDRVTEQGPTITGPTPDPDHVPDEDYPASRELEAEEDFDLDHAPNRDPSAAFGSGADDATTAAGPESAPHAETTAGAAHTADTSEPAPSAAGPAAADLDLDADGLPWDGRIHSSSKKKLAKTKQWKKRRKPNDQAEDQWERYVESVEAELRRVMQAGPHAPVEAKQPEPEPEKAAGPTPPPAAADKPAAPTGPTPPPAATGSAEIKTLPELFRLITDNNISDDKVMAAINAQGIDSLPLLGARPDLIPAVAKALQEG